MARHIRYAVRHPGSGIESNGPGSYLHSEHKTLKTARRAAQVLANKRGQAIVIERDEGDGDAARAVATVAPKKASTRGNVRYEVRHPKGYMEGPHHRTASAAKRAAKQLANDLNRDIEIDKVFGEGDYQRFVIVKPGPVRKRKSGGGFLSGLFG
jgi:hypothetical protein